MKNSPGIIFLVILVHGTLLISFFSKNSKPFTSSSTEKIKIHTHNAPLILAETSQPHVEVSSPLESSIKPVSTPKSIPKTSLVSKERKKESINKPLPNVQKPSKETNPSNKKKYRKELMALAEKSLSTLDAKKSLVFSPSSLKTLPSLSCEVTPEKEEMDAGYIKDLVLHLKNLLILPEKGRVKISVTLSETGKIENLKILFAESLANEEYVLSVLKNASFPSPPKSIGKKNNPTFTLVLMPHECL